MESALLEPLAESQGRVNHNSGLLTCCLYIPNNSGECVVSLKSCYKRDFNIWQVFLIVEIKSAILRWGNSLWESDFYVDKISNSTHLLLHLFTRALMPGFP